MKNKKAILAMLVTLTLVSFTGPTPSKISTLIMGTYSVCGCDDKAESAPKFGLVINEDHTFNYFDNSNPAKILDIKGNWTQDKNTILLKDFPVESRIENKWTIDKNGKCLKSNKGLSFTRLCNLKACN